MPTPPRQTALVTGASSGIGRDLAEILAKNGYDVILTARTRPALEKLAAELEACHGITATVITSDLATPTAAQSLYDDVHSRGINLDILINNAGVGDSGPFAKTDLHTDTAMIQLNITSLTVLTRLFLPGMLARNHGRIMNVASMAAFQPGPLMAVYYATKAYVLSLTYAIADEVRHSKVTLTALCPGPTRTNFSEIARLQGSKLFTSPILQDSRPVAEYGYRAMMRGKRIAVPGALNRLGVFLTRFGPRRILAAVPRRLHERRARAERS